MLKVAIIGAGFMGSTHARAYHALPDVEIAGIYGLSEQRAQPLAAELGVSHTTDLNRLIDDDSIDAVDICLPTPQHRPLTEAALAAGKHVLLEKPIALTMPDADALVQLGQSSDKVFMIAHVLRFWPEYVEAQRLIATGSYGKAVSGLAYRRQPFPAWSTLFSRPELTGGAVVDMMIHDVDALNWVFGVPRAVTAKGARNPTGGGWDQVQILIDYGHASALVDGGMLMPGSYPFSSTFQLLCETGAVEYHFRAGGRSFEMGGGVNDLVVYPNEGDPIKVTVEQSDAFKTEIAYFLDCIRSGQPAHRATPSDARLALQTTLAARESLESGAVVTL